VKKPSKPKKWTTLIAAIILFILGLYFSDKGSTGSGSGLILTFLSGYILAARHKIGGQQNK